MPFSGKLHEGAIYRLRTPPAYAVNYPYIVVSENPGEPADILTIREFNRIKKGIKKNLKKGKGLEILVSPARKMDSVSLGKWFSSLADLYKFCHWSRCQFIISSGAQSKYEMISGPCLDAILKTVDIDPQNHWISLGKWLEGKL